jgi:hypothetical protein
MIKELDELIMGKFNLFLQENSLSFGYFPTFSDKSC